MSTEHGSFLCKVRRGQGQKTAPSSHSEWDWEPMTTLHTHIKHKGPQNPFPKQPPASQTARLSAPAFLCFMAVGSPDINGSLFFEIPRLCRCREDCSFSVGPQNIDLLWFRLILVWDWLGTGAGTKQTYTKATKSLRPLASLSCANVNEEISFSRRVRRKSSGQAGRARL